jgi:cytochrome c oxidase subunit 1
MHTYVDGYGFNFWNMVSTIGAFIIAVSMLIFGWNVLASWRHHKANPVDVGPDPWDARSLEWMVPSPVPAHNFDESPTVSHLDEFWHRKYQEDEHGKVRRVATGAEVAQRGDAAEVHLPSPSYWPLVMALGLPLIGYGLIFNLGLAALGGLIVVIGGFGWGYEPADDPEAHHGPDGHDAHDGGLGGAQLQPGDGDGEAGDGDASRSDEAVPAGVTGPASTSTASAPVPGTAPESAEEAAADD